MHLQLQANPCIVSFKKPALIDLVFTDYQKSKIYKFNDWDV